MTSSPKRYEQPMPVRVRIERWVSGPFPEEVGVFIPINGKIIYAIVPADAVDNDTVLGVKIAETDDNVYVAMPPSTITSPQLLVPKVLQDKVFAT